MEKRTYQLPVINVVEIDNEITLQLSSAPAGPGESMNTLSGQSVSDPYKNTIS